MTVQCTIGRSRIKEAHLAHFKTNLLPHLLHIRTCTAATTPSINDIPTLLTVSAIFQTLQICLLHPYIQWPRPQSPSLSPTKNSFPQSLFQSHTLSPTPPAASSSSCASSPSKYVKWSLLPASSSQPTMPPVNSSSKRPRHCSQPWEAIVSCMARH